jgi:hypothetical protein
MSVFLILGHGKWHRLTIVYIYVPGGNLHLTDTRIGFYGIP